VAAAEELAQIQDFGLAMPILRRAIASNARSYDAMNILAQIYDY